MEGGLGADRDDPGAPHPDGGKRALHLRRGPDRCLWFCESGAAKIGRLDPARGAFAEFALPTPNSTPIGIIVGADGCAVVCAEKAASQIGRITLDGTITVFRLPTANAGPDGMMLRARRQRMVFRDRSEPHRADHAEG